MAAPVEVRLARGTVSRPGPLATNCHVWVKGTNRGYGQIMANHKTWLIHRLSWTLANGPIPKGMCVLHRCDNPPCHNVAHLWLGTQLQNIADRVAKGRGGINWQASKTHCPLNHPYDEANTRIQPDGSRGCKTCIHARQTVAYHKSVGHDTEFLKVLGFTATGFVRAELTAVN